MIIVQILISIVFYFILMLLSINLIGLLVRGLFTNPELKKLKSEGYDFINQEIEKDERANKWLTLIVFLGIIGYIYATFHFWNIGVTAVALLLMLSRIPDLLKEIKTGKKITKSFAWSTPKTALLYIATFLDIVALPALYYFLYHF